MVAAKIVRGDHVAVWLYGVKVDPFEDLPQFPELPPGELHILQPLPGDMTVFAEGPFQGRTFVEVASYPTLHCPGDADGAPQSAHGPRGLQVCLLPVWSFSTCHHGCNAIDEVNER